MDRGRDPVFQYAGNGRAAEGGFMIQGWAILAFSLGYVGFLFAIAHYGDKVARARGRPTAKPVVYALSLAVYCSSWTFYGSVGLASTTGYDFLTIYIGPILMFTLGWPLLFRIVRLAKSQNITSIADFIAARYGKSQILAATITVIVVIATLPYIALQLKAVSTSFMVLTHYPAVVMPSSTGDLPIWGDTALIASVILALFAILFGTRHIDATEHHEGMMLAIASESVMKLVAFLAVGAFVTWGMFGGFGDLAARAAATPELHRLFATGIDGTTWVTMTGLAFVAIICLPRQFHVIVVENADENDIRKATWLFPAYLVAINIFVVPIAIAGLITFPDGTADGDMFVLALPIAARQEALTLIAFLGGLSAATGMVIVASVAVSNMVSNDLIMPLLLRGRRLGLSGLGDLSRLILWIRRAAILALLLLSYLHYRMIGDSAALAAIGLLSFAAVAQFAPAFLGGLVWRGATQKGALAGILLGFLIWAYTLLLPAFVRSGWLPVELLQSGPFGIGFLRPEQLFGVHFDPLTHGLFWSLFANIVGYVGLSLWSTQSSIERLQASAFADAEPGESHAGSGLWRGSITVAELQTVAARYLGAERALRSFEDFAAQHGHGLLPGVDADLHLVRHTERLLASAIGAASARLVMALALERRSLNIESAMRLLDDASAAIQYNRDLLQSTLENVRQGISVFDKNLRLVSWNRRFRDLLDLPADLGRVGVPLEEIVRFNAQRGEYGPGRVDDLVAQRLASFVDSVDTIFERRRPNGTVLEIRTNPMPGGGYVTTYSDITERVRAAAELAAANENLEQRVHERTAELTALNAELSDANAAAEEANLDKTRFLAAASHDLLQPLNAARLYVSSLIERFARNAGHADGPERALVRNVDASLGSVEELLGALLDISKLDAGALTPEVGSFALDDLFTVLKVEFMPLAEKRGLELRIVRCGLTVESDRRLLHRVLQNLLSNALRYTARGKVLMGARRAGRFLLIQVWDTGSGIPQDKQLLVFKEFQRFAIGSGTEQGLGLGLSIVERISRILDHPVSLRSELGRGTMFTLRVPRGEMTIAPPLVAPEPARFSSALDRAVVLCIDNQASVLDGMRTLLAAWSRSVRVASGLSEALEVVGDGTERPDLVIVDYHLDEGDGIACVEALRRRLGIDLPAILITADRSDALKMRADALGLPLLNKPIKPAALRALITQTLADRQAAE
ncbi:hybrid sensor histidine kinase/response regulator [Virgifigura deserti]|uniref:PAS domain-containing hybrid sensor histidine kinase/response regulator n=1 Tax=Virgifigura deserti TaxID=2268457 RepID=UPI003CCC1262